MRIHRVFLTFLPVLGVALLVSVAVASEGSAQSVRTSPPVNADDANVLDVRINVSNTCRTSVTPPSYAVPAGSTFTVNWINVANSEYLVDIDKIDRYNTVPIVLGLGPGQSYHDDIRAWCGQYTGTFSFRITSPCDQVYIPIDCNAH